jgi:methionine salvage enolase-phosphatase E1
MTTIRLPNSAVIEVFDVLIDREQFEREALQVCHEQVQTYLTTNWSTPKLQRLVKRVRKRSRVQAAAASTQDPFEMIQVPPTSSQYEEMRKQIVLQVMINYCLLRFETRPAFNTPEYLLQSWIRKEALTNGRLRTRLYPGVFELLHRWRMEQFVKLFAWDERPSQDMWTYLRQTTVGDVSVLFNNCVQVPQTARTEASFYRSVATLLRDRPSNVLFVNSKREQVQAASVAGLDCVWIRNGAQCSGSNDSHGSNVKVVESLVQLSLVDNQDGSRSIDRTCC